jgi:hypothetical protein
MQTINGVRKKQPGRVVVAPDAKLLVSREEAAQLLSISQRGLRLPHSEPQIAD